MECEAFPARSTQELSMRRLTAISALVVLLSLWSAPLLAAMTAPSPNNLPACCRRNGRHHCMMQSMQQGSETQFSAPPEKCPFSPAHLLPGVTGVHLFTAPASSLFYASVVSHPALVAQAQARYRVASDRARLKRGPPAATPLFLL